MKHGLRYLKLSGAVGRVSD